MKKLFFALAILFSTMIISCVPVQAQNVQDQLSQFGGIAGGTNTYTVSIPAITSCTFKERYEITIRVGNVNTDASTLNINSCGAKSITINGSALSGGEIPANINIKFIYSSLNGGQWQMQPYVPNSSISPLPIVNGGTNATTASGAINNLLPSQTGNSGKFLTTNGSAASWGTVSQNFWGLSGNSGTTAGTNFIGTTDSIDFVFKTDGIERMRIKRQGSVGGLGIGTTTPTAQLDAIGTTTTSAGYTAKFSNSSGLNLGYLRNDGYVRFGASNITTGSQFTIVENTGAVNAALSQGFSLLNNSNQSSLGFYSYNQGTNYPTIDFDYERGAGQRGRFQFRQGNNKLNIINGDVGDGYIGDILVGSNDGAIWFWFDHTKQFGINTNGSPSAGLHVVSLGTTTGYAMKVENASNSAILYAKDNQTVGIGGNPNSMLTINENSSSQTFRIQNNSDGNDFSITSYGDIVVDFQPSTGKRFQQRISGNVMIFNAISAERDYSFGSNSSSTGYPYFYIDGINKQIIINKNAGSATIHAFATDSTSSGYALKLDNNSVLNPKALLYVRDDGYCGFNKSSPSAIIDAVGTGTTNATYTAKFKSASTEYFYLRDDRRMIYKDGNEGNGKFLTSDADGVATWQDPNSICFTTINTHTVVGCSPLTLDATAIVLSNELVQTPQYVIPTTGNTITADGRPLIVDPAGALLALTISFPSSPLDGQIFSISFSQAITSLTLNNATILGTLTSVAGVGSNRWIYSSTASKWFPY